MYLFVNLIEAVPVNVIEDLNLVVKKSVKRPQTNTYMNEHNETSTVDVTLHIIFVPVGKGL